MEWWSLCQGCLRSTEYKTPGGLSLTSHLGPQEHILAGSSPCAHHLQTHLCVSSTQHHALWALLNVSYVAVKYITPAVFFSHNGPLSPTSFMDLGDVSYCCLLHTISNCRKTTVIEGSRWWDVNFWSSISCCRA